jgi:PKD repeat protein
MFRISLLLFLFIGSISFAQNAKKVLFIGNSYTGYNNLPKMVDDIANSVGDDIDYTAHTPGGTTLQGHANSSQLTTKINSDNWDFVTIQAQSQEPSFPTGQFLSQTAPYATQIVNKIKQNNECTEPIFFMTWGRENGDQQNCPIAPWLCTYQGMDDSLRSRYTYMANQNASLISPVGAVWRYLRDNNLGIDLYTADESHPSIFGSYTAALTFYTIIFQKDPTLITLQPSGVNNANATTIKNAVKQVVFNDLAEWNIGKYDPKAEFSYSVSNLNEVDFTNTSSQYSSLTWNFGDGDTSSVQNPNHTYAQNGEYTVTLTVEKCGKIDSLTQKIEIKGLSILEQNTNENIFYDFQSSTIQIKENPQDITLFDINGKQILSRKVNQSISLDHLTKGIYFIHWKEGDTLHKKKIVKM